MTFRLLILFTLLGLLVACQSDPPPPEAESPPAAPPELEPYTYTDSTALTEYGPYFTFHLTTLQATGGDPALRQLLNDSLTARVIHRTLPADSTLAQALPTYLAAQFADYRAQEVDPEFLQEAPRSYSREEYLRTEALYTSDSLFVLAYRYYVYTGGAHGMSFTFLQNFAANPPRSIGLEDVFRPDSEGRLSELLTAGARQQEVPLRVDSVPVTGNLALLPGGIRFTYDPYAIGPAAAGEIDIELPYDSLDVLLRESIRPVIRPLR